MTTDVINDSQRGRVTGAVAAYRQIVGKAWSQRRLRAQTADLLLAAGLAAWALLDVPWWWRPPGHSGTTVAILGVLGLAAAQSLPFLWRRRQPAAVLVAAGGCLAVKYAAHLNIWSAGAAVLAAAYGLGAYGVRPARTTARLLAGAAVVAALVSLQASGGNHTAAVACALLATALVTGEVTSAHRDAATAAARHAHELERASLAREIHDVVAHQLSAIAVQAGAARLASAADPWAAAEAVAAIEQEARGGLAELNKLVKGLRQARGADQDASPRLQDVPGLIERARESGLRAELVVDGEPRALADPVELGDGVTGDRERTTGSLTAMRDDPGLLARRARAGLAELAGCGLAREPLAAVGFCFGGLAALTLARSGAPLAAAVSIHGSLATSRPAAPGAVKARVLACHGALDPHVPMADVTGFAQEMDHAGAGWQLNIHGGAMHGFTHQHAAPGAVPGVAYHRPADERSYAATRALLAETLT